MKPLPHRQSRRSTPQLNYTIKSIRHHLARIGIIFPQITIARARSRQSISFTFPTARPNKKMFLTSRRAQLISACTRLIPMTCILFVALQCSEGIMKKDTSQDWMNTCPLISSIWQRIFYVIRTRDSMI